MKDETKLEVKLSEETTQEDEETKKKLSMPMKGLMPARIEIYNFSVSTCKH